jgi:hypothetical protein
MRKKSGFKGKRIHLSLGLVEFSELLVQVLVRNVGAVGVENVHNHLLSLQETVREEFTGANSDGVRLYIIHMC